MSILSFASYNPEAKRTILLVHGAFSSRDEWDTVRPSLTGSGDSDNLEQYHLLIPDLPAHGQSLTTQPFTIATSVELLAQLIKDQAHGGIAHVIGFSLGAHVASHLAARYPGLVASLFLSGFNIFAPSVFAPVFPPLLYAIQHMAELVLHPMNEVAKVQRGEGSLALCRGVVETLVSGRELEGIDGGVVPTLIVAATKEGLLPKDRVGDAKRLFGTIVRDESKPSLMRESRVVQHRGIRHAWQVEEPDLMVKTARAWIDGGELVDEFEDL